MKRAHGISLTELNEKGKKLYEEKFKDKLEKKYLNKIIAIEVKSGKYFMGDSVIDAVKKARKEFPYDIFYSVRVGSSAVYHL